MTVLLLFLFLLFRNKDERKTFSTHFSPVAKVQPRCIRRPKKEAAKNTTSMGTGQIWQRLQRQQWLSHSFFCPRILSHDSRGKGGQQQQIFFWVSPCKNLLTLRDSHQSNSKKEREIKHFYFLEFFWLYFLCTLANSTSGHFVSFLPCATNPC